MECLRELLSTKALVDLVQEWNLVLLLNISHKQPVLKEATVVAKCEAVDLANC